MKLPKNYHDLKQYGIEFFRARAGYIPPQMPPNHHWLDDIRVNVKLYKIVQMWYANRVKYNRLVIELPSICGDCTRHIKFHEMRKIDIGICEIRSTLMSFARCELCGNLGIESENPY